MWNSEYKSLQGNIGVARAIDYFVSSGICISIPMNDTQKYDLVAEIDTELKKISVKTTSQIAKSGNYIVTLKNSGGSSGRSVIRNFNPNDVDYLFVLCSNRDMLLIPTSDLDTVSTLTITPDRLVKYQVYIN